MEQYSSSDTAIYQNNTLVIIAFRGTANINDIKSDIQLSLPGGECSFDRLEPSLQLVEQFLEETDESVLVQLTGHSLGGALARCVGNSKQLGVICFNGAAPPSNPISIGINQINYHIVFDVISAWQPSVRIDTGIRPTSKNSIYDLSNVSFNDLSILPIAKAHSMQSFTQAGVLSNAAFENALLVRWYQQLPFVARLTLLSFLLIKRLPPVP